jgi:hypothetical protein
VAGAVIGAVVAGVGVLTVVDAGAASSPVYGTYVPTNTTIERAPYVTDLTISSAEVNWAIGGKNPSPGYVEYGTGGSCTTHTVKPLVNGLPAFVPTQDTPAGTSYQVGVSGQSVYQDSVQVSGLTASTTYCYEVFSSAGALLGPSQSFTTLDSPSATTPLTFDVVGDLGDTIGVDEVGNVNADQAAIDQEIGQSGAKFVVTAGDVAYTGGTDTDYGDLTDPPTSPTAEVSDIFGPQYWPETGGIPTFAGDGNHGAIITGLRTWPEEATAAASKGTYDYNVNETVDGTTASAPDNWYAFSDAGVRIYVLDASWGDSADGTTDTNTLCPTAEQGITGDCKGYQMDDAAHWQPSSAEMTWLKGDLSNPAYAGQIKMAVFHYPVNSVENSQPSDPYLQRDLVPVLEAGGVSIVFNGHAHTYQRFSPASGLISYVTGGGGGNPIEPVDGNGDKSGHCAAALATPGLQIYALGWSPTNSKGSVCSNTPNQTAVPAAAADVYNFLKVTVNAGQVTVAPENALGVTFDSVTYQLGTVTPPTTTTPSTTTTTLGSTTTTTSGSGGTGPQLFTSAPASGPSVTLPEAATTGDLLVYSASQYTGASNHISAVTDNAGDKWAMLQAPYSVGGHNSEGELWYTYATGSVSTVTATTKATSIASEVQVFSGVTVGAVPASGSGSQSSNVASSSASAGGLEVGFVAGHGNAEPITLASGLTPQSQVPSALGTSISTLITGYEISGGSGTFSGTFPTAMYWASGVATFPAG